MFWDGFLVKCCRYILTLSERTESTAGTFCTVSERADTAAEQIFQDKTDVVPEIAVQIVIRGLEIMLVLSPLPPPPRCWVIL
jgi:hypothetical protein